MQMKKTNTFLILWLFFCLISCELSDSKKQEQNSDIGPVVHTQENARTSQVDEIPFEINMEELFGDWVLIGVGADRMGPGIAPVGELLFAFRDNGNMTVATEGKDELLQNLEGIPSPYILEDTKMCSDDVLFKLQFKEECCEIIRLHEGRMSVKVEIPNGEFIYKHFVKLDE